MQQGVILGIDLGPNSLGWALLRLNDSNEGIIAVGARAFEAGLDNLETDGRGKSRNVERREARLRRRQYERRSRRKEKLAHILQQHGLFPSGHVDTSEGRHNILNNLDASLNFVSPFKLRAKALNEKLSPLELGRVFYHLAQRRGFKSNRKSTLKKNEDIGKVKQVVSELQKAIEQNGKRTLGEYFAGLNPYQQRIRGRYTSRQMYEDEFHQIWESQRRYHPELLTDDLRKVIHDAIFKQRPLKSQKHLVGTCELEPGRKRAPLALLMSQRFRYLQKINDLQILNLDTGEVRDLTEEERQTLTQSLEHVNELSFPRIRKLLKLQRTCRFNLEEGGEKRLMGNRTAAKIIDAIGLERWQKLSEQEHDALVEDMRSIVEDETLKKRCIRVWKFDEETAEKLSQIALEEGYVNFSKQAITMLLPRLEAGTSLQTAIKELYPERFERLEEPLEFLPPLDSDYMPDIRNPIVTRSLTELRRVVNAIIKQHGKPDFIHIELGRDLRQTAKQREKTVKRMRANEKARKDAAGKIAKEAKINNPSRDDILKVLLAEECDWTCPYTGRKIKMQSLLGAHPQFDIEHIIPRDRSLDDSFFNKTLCYAEENRNRKHNRTPYEAYHGTEQWDDIIARVRRFKGDARNEKLRRFLMTPEEVEKILPEFTSRQMNDMRYAARLAKKYLGLLYGGVKDDGIDTDGKRRVMATSGGVTAYLREVWGLNSILGDGPGKSRDDHRHHAVDAIVVALTDAGTIKMLSDAARRAQLERRRRFGKVEPPWEGFLQQVREHIHNVVTSHRLDKRVRGPMHEETFYGTPYTGQDGKTYVHVRKPVEALSARDIDSIVDPSVREAVKTKLAELGQQDPKKAFAAPENHPSLKSGDNRSIPIHRVRIRRALETFPVGRDGRIRYVQSDTNHHMEIFEVLDEKGQTIKWDAEVVSMYDAYQRKIKGEPIVRRNHGKRTCFLFSLACGEIIELDNEDGSRSLYRVRTVPQSKQIRFVPINDARPLKDISKVGMTAYPETLRKRNCRKVLVTPLGEVRYAND
jgi:CRISPR-associated endonuclease Csn1